MSSFVETYVLILEKDHFQLPVGAVVFGRLWKSSNTLGRVFELNERGEKGESRFIPEFHYLTNFSKPNRIKRWRPLSPLEVLALAADE